MITPFRSARLRSVNRPALLALTGAGLFLASLDAYVVVTALLPMLTSVHIAVNRPEQATPIITGFLLGYLAVMPIAGGLSDRFGRIRVFAACLALFAFGSFLTATAPSLSQLVTGRLLQGAGGGALVPAVLALAADLYPAGDRSPVLGAVSALQEIGSVLGPLWGGLITASSFGWTWIFWLNIPVAALLVWALWPEIRSRADAHQPAKLDWLGALLATAGLALLTLALYAANPEQSPVGESFFWQAPLAVVCFALFVWHERRTSHPLINVRRFRDSSFSGSALTNAIAGAGLMVALVYIPVLANAVFSMNASGAALLLFRLMLGIPIGALLGGWLAQRLRSYRLVAALGLVLAAIGFVMLSGWNEGSLKPHLLGLPLTVADGELFLTGLGLGIEIAPVSAALLDAVGEAERGAGASFLIIMRLVGMLVGFSLVAGFGLWEFHRATAHLLPPLPGLNPNFATQFAIYSLKVRQAIFDEYHLIFRATAVALLVGALTAAATLRPLPRPRWQ
ncbi:MAG TPA: MFS transporter [Candidatus Dormibacteraeota bacterium]|nr:MFS transporter [Candidatus Dormibacteraeota bacterium]